MGKKDKTKLRTKTIIFVDERWEVRQTINTLLTKNGYNVILAAGNGECIEKLRKVKPNLLLIGYVTTRGKILDYVKKIKKTRVAYLITDESEEEHLELYENVIGFLKGSDNINVFLKKIKQLLK